MSFSHSQNDIIPKMKSLNLNADDEGVCAGLVVLWVAFATEGRTQEYTDIIDRICHKDFLSKYNALKNKLAARETEISIKKFALRSAVKEKRKQVNNLEQRINELKEAKEDTASIEAHVEELNKLQCELLILIRDRESKEFELENQENYLTREEKQILEAFSFLQWVDLTFQPSRYQPFLTQYFTQKNLQELADNLLADSHAKIEQIFLDTRIDTEEELQQYFEDLVDEFKKLEDKNLPVSISGRNHRIGLQYDEKKDVWILADPNGFFKVKRNEIAKRVIKAAIPNPQNEKSQFGCLSVAIWSNKKNPSLNSTKEALQVFRSKQTVTKEMTERIDLGNNNLIDMAIRCGDVETLKKSIEHKVDLQSAITTSAEAGFVPVIQFLKQERIITEENYIDTANTAARYGKIAIMGPTT